MCPVASIASCVVRRDLPDGSLDTSFGSDGKVTTGFETGVDIALSMAVAGDTVVLAGTSGAGGVWAGAQVDGGEVAVARYHLGDGSLDTSFGSDGRATPYVTGDDVGEDVAVRSDGGVTGFSL